MLVYFIITDEWPGQGGQQMTGPFHFPFHLSFTEGHFKTKGSKDFSVLNKHELTLTWQ